MAIALISTIRQPSAAGTVTILAANNYMITSLAYHFMTFTATAAASSSVAIQWKGSVSGVIFFQDFIQFTAAAGLNVVQNWQAPILNIMLARGDAIQETLASVVNLTSISYTMTLYGEVLS